MIHSKTQDGFPIEIPSSFHDYKIIQIIGCGSTCIVALVENKKTHEQFSAKIISKTDISNRNMLESINNEINVLKTLNHEHIIKLIESFEIKSEENDEEEYIVMITEFCENGDLLSFVVNQKFKDEVLMKKIIKQFLEAVKYLHKKGISHGDIKAENILLGKGMSVKLCDFGYCRTSLIAGDDSKNGTIYYAAPELFRKGQFDTLKTDIYAIGITLYSISELQFPFKDGDQQYIVEQIVKSHLSIRRGLNKQLRRLIENCTAMKPSNRPNIDDLLKDEYLNNEKLSEKENKSSIKQSLLTFKDSQKSDDKFDTSFDEFIVFGSD